MVSEEFYQNIYLDVFFLYIILNKKQYELDNIKCTILENDDLHRVIYFDLPEIYGRVTIWNTAIIEEEIFRKDNDELLFYLHYKMATIAQCHTLFNEFYQSLKSQSVIPPRKILLCCSGGLTTSLFAQKLQELINLEKLNIQVDAIGFHQLQKYYRNYDSIYLAPQIAYLEPTAMKITNREVPVYSIAPATFATQDYKGLLQCFLSEINESIVA